MKFIDRKQEMARLDSLMKLQNGGVAVVWGRRRIGKSRLLLEWASKHHAVYYTADESAPALQRKYFALALEQVLPGFGAVDYPDWTALFMRLGKDSMQAGWRGPLIIDELPYLVAASPELPSVLQKFLDLDAKRSNMVLVLCGSSQRMMQGAILDASAPLYGRADEIIKLTPISVGYMGDALDLKNSRDEIEFYAVWGGIPKYWELVQNHGGTLLECIDSLVLDPMGALNDEPNRILLEEIPSAVSLRPILDAIGLGAHRLSEIATRIGQPITSLGRPIQRLLELDLIVREMPYGSHEHRSKRTLYKIKDFFVRFWFDIVASRRSHFAQAPSSNRKKWLKENLQYFFSNAWEEICRQAVPLLFQEKGISFGPASRYWQHGHSREWDIVARSLDEEAILLGESKWVSKIPSNDWIQKTIAELKAKGLPPLSYPPNQRIYYALFIPKKPLNCFIPFDTKIIDAEEVIQFLK